MSGWSTLFDVANLAINVGQSAQLAAQREKLASLQEQAMVEALRRQLIEEMRNFVFASGEQLKVLAEYKEEAPQAVFVTSGVMAWKFEAGGVTPEVFPEFRDKEYVQQVRKRLQETFADARDRLNETERQEAEECVQAITQMPLLNEAIELQSEAEELEKTQQEWNRLELGREQYPQKAKNILIGAVVLSLLLCVVSGLSGSSNSGFGVVACSLGGLALVGGGIAYFVMNSKGRTPEWERLKRKRQTLQRKKPDESKVRQIRDVLGTRTSQGYKTMRAMRQELIHRVLSGAAKFALPPELLDSVDQGAP